ncbi:MAG TPA: uroporphyrinogen-III synthase [Vicinamibacterales bacterium]
MSDAPWRVAITREEDATGPWHLALEDAGFVPMSCPVAIEGPAPDPHRLAATAAHLADYDWVICSSARSVRALMEASATLPAEGWPRSTRYAAVGAVTAAAMAAAGASPPVVSGTGGAEDLWERLQPLETWPGRRVLVATVPGGRRELIEGLRSAGASVEEVECYTMRTRDASEIRRDWESAQPDAVLLASPSAARQVVAAVGVDTLRALKAVIPIGRTTAAALASVGIDAEPPAVATFEAIIERLITLRAAAFKRPSHQDLKTSRRLE